MEGNSLIDPSKPLIIIQITDEDSIMMATNIDDVDNVLYIMEEVIENIHHMGMDAYAQTNNVLKKFLQ